VTAEAEKQAAALSKKAEGEAAKVLKSAESKAKAAAKAASSSGSVRPLPYRRSRIALSRITPLLRCSV